MARFDIGQPALYLGQVVYVCTKPYKALNHIGEYYTCSDDGHSANMFLGAHRLKPAPGVAPIDVASCIQFSHGDAERTDMIYNRPVRLIFNTGDFVDFDNIAQAHDTVGTRFETIISHAVKRRSLFLRSQRYYPERSFSYRFLSECD